MTFAVSSAGAFELVGVPAETVLRAKAAWPSPLDGLALLPSALVPSGSDHPRFRAVPDGNRAAILPDVHVVVDGRTFFASVKGVGALAPLYGASPIDDGPITAAPRAFYGESWMGEAPYGGQGEAGARFAIEVTDMAIEGFAVCPVTDVVAIPEQAMAKDRFWYRRHRGAVLQEHRLVPSDVRLFHSSLRALGRDTAGALAALGVSDVRALDAFLDRYLASGIAALTLFARTARSAGALFEGLDYDDAWLDKDSIVAPDGTLFFADLEALEWKLARDARVIERQVHRNQYELFYGLDAMLDVRDAWTESPDDPAARRASVITRIELALAGDRTASARVTADGLDLVVRSSCFGDVVVRLVDRR
jgi:hypothetical protein